MISSLNGSTGRPLRLLIVDDNHINLSILSTLLKRRFSHIIEGAPVPVDSGLKAIQLLRTHVFDCILMDIQMPFLSGLDASRRIRNGEDGVLPANSGAHIVAVTTAIGDEPEFAYRRAAMDGMIGKPVRFHDLQQYLLPLAQEAKMAAKTVKPILIDGEDIMPPLPPASKHERVFYLPANAAAPILRPDICDGSDFEQLLKAQTLLSLQQHGAGSVIRSASLTHPTRAGKAEGKGTNGKNTDMWPQSDNEATSSTSSRSNSSSSVERIFQPVLTLPTSSPAKSHCRSDSMTISRRTLSKQIAREIANADLSEDVGGNICSSTFRAKVASSSLRPTISHRSSSPAWLWDDGCVDSGGPSRLWDTPQRPVLPILGEQQDIDSFSSGTSGATSSDSLDNPTMFSPPLRRESQTSSISTCSDASSTVTTPARENPVSVWRDECGMPFGKDHNRHHSGNTIGPLYSDGYFANSTEACCMKSESATLNPSSTNSLRPLSVTIGSEVRCKPGDSPPDSSNVSKSQRHPKSLCPLDVGGLAEDFHRFDFST